MTQEQVQRISDFVRQEMEGLCAAHDFLHIERVVENAQTIWKEEQRGDILTIEAGAYLHEALDEKFFASENILERKENISVFLENIGLSQEEKQTVIFIIENVGFWKSLERWIDFFAPEEFYIVEDADRLESVGAIAIARTFTYGWKKGRPIYDPEIHPIILSGKQEYYGMRKTEYQNTSLNHFYEKLFLIKDLMHTKTAKKIAEPRHEFMELFLKQFLDEWNGKI